MRISELITKLQLLQNVQGDLRVTTVRLDSTTHQNYFVELGNLGEPAVTIEEGYKTREDYPFWQDAGRIDFDTGDLIIRSLVVIK